MNKKVIWVGIASALLIGGGIFWWMRNKNKPTNEPKKEEEEKGTNEMATTTTTSYDSTGFNQEQGDAFRLWMNKNYPDWRFNGDKLDPTGKPDNTTIRAAYKDYGSIYNSEIKKSQETKSVVDTSLKKGDAIYLRTKGKTFLYELPSLKSVFAYLDADKIYGSQLKNKRIIEDSIGEFISPSTEGFSKIKVTVPHQETGLFGGVLTRPKEVYINSLLITNKKP